MRNSQFNHFYLAIIASLSLVFQLSVCAGSGGVEFRQAELSIEKKTLSLFHQRIQSSRFDADTGILTIVYKSYSKSKKLIGHLEVGFLDGEIVSQKIDSNGDGFFNILKTSRPSRGIEYEERHDRNFDKSYDFITSHISQNDGFLLQIENKVDENFDGIFNKKSKQLGFSRQAMIAGGSGKACFDREVFSIGGELGNQIFTIAESYGLNYSSSSLNYSEAKFRVDIEKSCDASTSEVFSDGTTFDSIMKEAINEGLNCLRSPGVSDHYQFEGQATRSDDPLSVAGVVYLNSVSMLLGQQIFENPLGANGADNQGFPVRTNDRDFRNLTVMCSESSSAFKAASSQKGGWLESLRGNFSSGEALGLGSTGRSSGKKNIQCSSGNVQVEHPYISLNMAKFKTSMSQSSDSDKRSELKRLVFHEYLHTTGMEHEAHFDPVTSCSICCFPYSDRELVQRACNACRGESALGLGQASLERQVDLQAPFLEIMGVTPVQYRDSLGSLSGKVSSGVIQNLQQRVK